MVFVQTHSLKENLFLKAWYGSWMYVKRTRVRKKLKWPGGMSVEKIVDLVFQYAKDFIQYVND